MYVPIYGMVLLCFFSALGGALLYIVLKACRP